MYSLVFIVGTRPEIIKMAPVILEAEKRNIPFTIIHTGQHYDKEMSDQFFEVLKLRKPDFNLGVQAKQANEQLGDMIKKLGKLLLEISPNLVLAVGDTMSVLAACLASINNQISFGHIESGLRSYDNTMPEEINRRMVDSVSSILFAPSQRAVVNLLYEGIDTDRIHFVGNTIVDSLRIFGENIEQELPKVADELLKKIQRDFIICTIHRVSNVENETNLKEIVDSLEEIKDASIIFLLHPRTAKKLEEFNLMSQFKNIENMTISSSIDYLSILSLMRSEKCKLILTDSGGLQEEAAYLKIPCITLRPNTERPETVEQEINKLVRINKIEIINSVKQTLSDVNIKRKFDEFIFPYGDGNSSKKILNIIENNLDNLSFVSPEIYSSGSLSFFLIEIKTKISRSLVENNFNCTITLVYDERGQPIPIPDELQKGYWIRVSVK
ncbi:MAG: UDP-N-acetylglucosamine 2-epimerase (non-hydrolyzing) [Candidatus Heimdallarchaeota archaeon]|nr:UDP-N-acetylglucosamine 2-epimerase (non-hydrolyzing) [Candidatus Heimdallarchaeota archaeon]MCK4878895.1 UDP-N-acetylglucosamine 2-epimerase (non-hydrolyzing) [Candidatus Heimdallarchaeota archaeon]